jgi:di/tricarboxylate transporter
MGFDAWITLGTTAVVLLTLVCTSQPPDLIMIGALTLLLTVGVITPQEALSGFASEGLITVAALFVVATGLRETGGISWIAQCLLGRPKTLVGAQARLMAPVAAISAFMNNTPLVALMVPVVSDWAKKVGVPISKLMMPLSFATILGGLCTLIGTSTNVIIGGLLLAATGSPLAFFDLTWVGVPCALAGIVYMLLASRWLLPDRKPAISVQDDVRQYTVEMLVEPGSPLIGKTVEAAGLRHLVGMYLMEIDRDGQIISMVGPDEVLEAKDQLVFVGIVESVVELQRIRGLRPATDEVFKLSFPRPRRCLVEAVVSNSSRLLGQSIREGRFRSVYNAVVIAVARHGERLNQKLGDIVLQPGDTLLLEAHNTFSEQHRNSRDFFLVNRIEDSTPPRHDRAGIAVGILAAMVLVAGLEWMSMLNAAMLAAGAMILTGCLTAATARRFVDWQVLLVIAAGLGLGKAMEKTGAATAIAQALMELAGDHPWTALAVVYLLTMAFTELLTNNAAAALTFPIAMATAHTLQVNHMPFVVAIAMAASCGFATPIGYQTNLMVYGPGGYHFSDYLRFGGLLNLIVAAVTIALAPLVWPFAE